MVVDDDLDVREAIVDAIHATGRLVYGAASGAEALRLVESIPLPCLILLDVSMPELTGIETLERLRRLPQFDETTVVLMSATDRRAMDYARRLPGVQGVLPKPFAVAKLVRLLDKHCAPSESIRH